MIRVVPAVCAVFTWWAARAAVDAVQGWLELRRMTRPSLTRSAR